MINRNIVKLSTGKIIHDFIEAPFAITVQSIEIVKGIAKIHGLASNGCKLELLSFDADVVANIKKSWNRTIKPGVVLTGMLPYRAWTGRYNMETRHQLYLDARGQQGESGVFTLAMVKDEAPTQELVTEGVDNDHDDLMSGVLTGEQVNAMHEDECPCRKTKLGACHKADAKKYH